MRWLETSLFEDLGAPDLSYFAIETMLATNVVRRIARPVSKRCVSFKTENKISEIRQKYYMNPEVGKEHEDASF